MNRKRLTALRALRRALETRSPEERPIERAPTDLERRAEAYLEKDQARLATLLSEHMEHLPLLFPPATRAFSALAESTNRRTEWRLLPSCRLAEQAWSILRDLELARTVPSEIRRIEERIQEALREAPPGLRDYPALRGPREILDSASRKFRGGEVHGALGAIEVASRLVDSWSVADDYASRQLGQLQRRAKRTGSTELQQVIELSGTLVANGLIGAAVQVCAEAAIRFRVDHLRAIRGRQRRALTVHRSVEQGAEQVLDTLERFTNLRS